MSPCGEKYIAKKRRQYTSLPQSLSDVMLVIVFTVTRTLASSHAFVELANNGQHCLWYAEKCEHHPPPLSVHRALLLEIDEKHQERDSPRSSMFLTSAHDECIKYVFPRQKGRAGTPLRVSPAQGDAITPGLRTTKSRHHPSNHRHAADATAVEWRLFCCDKVYYSTRSSIGYLYLMLSPDCTMRFAATHRLHSIQQQQP